MYTYKINYAKILPFMSKNGHFFFHAAQDQMQPFLKQNFKMQLEAFKNVFDIVPGFE